MKLFYCSVQVMLTPKRTSSLVKYIVECIRDNEQVSISYIVELIIEEYATAFSFDDIKFLRMIISKKMTREEFDRQLKDGDAFVWFRAELQSAAREMGSSDAQIVDKDTGQSINQVGNELY